MKNLKANTPLNSDILNDFMNLQETDESVFISKTMGLAAIIEDAIKSKGWSKKEFAKLMKVKPSTISKWLSGDHNFELRTLSKIEENLRLRLIVSDPDEFEQYMEIEGIRTELKGSTSRVASVGFPFNGSLLNSFELSNLAGELHIQGSKNSRISAANLSDPAGEEEMITPIYG